jgi:hypothetical protein
MNQSKMLALKPEGSLCTFNSHPRFGLALEASAYPLFLATAFLQTDLSWHLSTTLVADKNE